MYGALEGAARVVPRRAWEALVRTGMSATLAAMLGPGVAPDPAWLSSLVAARMRPGAWRDLEAVARDLGAVLAGARPEMTELLDALPSVRVPVAIVRGALDPVVGRAELERLRETLPEATLHEFPGVAHCAQREDVEGTARVIVQTAARAGLVPGGAAWRGGAG